VPDSLEKLKVSLDEYVKQYINRDSEPDTLMAIKNGLESLINKAMQDGVFSPIIFSPGGQRLRYSHIEVLKSPRVGVVSAHMIYEPMDIVISYKLK